MTDLIIETKDLTKKYGDFVAVRSLNLSVKQGEIFGLLGPNGAGKTTTILMLLGLTEPTSGQVKVMGFDPTHQPLRIKSQAGYMPDQVGFYDELTARENLAYIAKLNGLAHTEAEKRISEVLDKVNLSKVANNRVATFSRGMRQRLAVADVLIKNPRLIIMDEPTQGLDPESAREFLSLIKGLSKSGITILLSSHLLHQVQETCDRVGLFRSGEMVLEGTVSELAKKVLGGKFHIKLRANGSDKNYLEELRLLPFVVEVNFKAPDQYSLIATKDLRAEAAKTVVNADGQLYSLEVDNVSLDEIYNTYFQEVKNDNNQ
jgi:ABC-2 type transport system ATP-binding protein